MKTTLLIQMLSRLNSHAFAALQISLTPCFSWVCRCRDKNNRFNGFDCLPLILALASASSAQQSPQSGTADPNLDSKSQTIAETPYAVVDRDANQAVWSRITLETNSSTGQISSKTNSYIEIATGLNFLNQATAKWEMSQEEFQITKAGYAIATNGQHSLILAPDIASGGAIDLLNPDGIRLVSNPMGLSFADSATGKNVLIAQVTNCLGELASENSVVYGRAFDAVRAAIRLSYTRSGVEQDV